MCLMFAFPLFYSSVLLAVYLSVFFFFLHCFFHCSFFCCFLRFPLSLSFLFLFSLLQPLHHLSLTSPASPITSPRHTWRLAGKASSLTCSAHALSANKLIRPRFTCPKRSSPLNARQGKDETPGIKAQNK